MEMLLQYTVLSEANTMMNSLPIHFGMEVEPVIRYLMNDFLYLLLAPELIMATPLCSAIARWAHVHLFDPYLRMYDTVRHKKC